MYDLLYMSFASAIPCQMHHQHLQQGVLVLVCPPTQFLANSALRIFMIFLDTFECFQVGQKLSLIACVRC